MSQLRAAFRVLGFSPNKLHFVITNAYLAKSKPVSTSAKAIFEN